jgi:serine/threonine protein kinase
MLLHRRHSRRSRPHLQLFYRRGSSGFVQLAIDLHTGEHVAIKFVERGDSFSHTSITRELFNQRLCSGHPHIVQILVRCAEPSCLLLSVCPSSGLCQRLPPSRQCGSREQMCSSARSQQTWPGIAAMSDCCWPLRRTSFCCRSTWRS